MDGNRATINDTLKQIPTQGRTYKIDGLQRTYKIIPYKVETYESIDSDGMIISKELVTYSIKDSSKKTIGTVTQYTTMERLNSLLKRYENPNHMEEIEIIGRIGSIAGSLYLVINESIMEWANILVDDCVDLLITRKDGLSYAAKNYHVSMNKSTYILNLNDIRRLTVEEDGLQLQTVKDFKTVSMSDSSKLFVKKGDVVKVKMTPNPTGQKYTFADKMRKEIHRKNKVANRNDDDDL